VTSTPADESPVAFRPTLPDAIPPGAWGALELLAGELPLSAWRTPHGFLVMTNLRCIAVVRKSELFRPRPWHVGPEFYFYNLRPPRVLFGKFVELAEDYDENGWVGRFVVQDPPAVVAEIMAHMDSGRAAWSARRAHTEELIRARAQARAALAAPGPHAPVLVRCSFCGNLVDVTRRRCPYCGAVLG